LVGVPIYATIPNRSGRIPELVSLSVDATIPNRSGRIPELVSLSVDATIPNPSGRIPELVALGVDATIPNRSGRIPELVSLDIDALAIHRSSRIAELVCLKVRLSIGYCHKTEQNCSNDKGRNFHFATPWFAIQISLPPLTNQMLYHGLPPCHASNRLAPSPFPCVSPSAASGLVIRNSAAWSPRAWAARASSFGPAHAHAATSISNNIKTNRMFPHSVPCPA
jgi:hypothetical protein